MENRIMVYFKTSTVKVFKVILQKLELLTNFFKTFPDCSLPSTISKNTIKMIGHHAVEMQWM